MKRLLIDLVGQTSNRHHEFNMSKVEFLVSSHPLTAPSLPLGVLLTAASEVPQPGPVLGPSLHPTPSHSAHSARSSFSYCQNLPPAHWPHHCTPGAEQPSVCHRNRSRSLLTSLLASALVPDGLCSTQQPEGSQLRTYVGSFRSAQSPVMAPSHWIKAHTTPQFPLLSPDPLSLPLCLSGFTPLLSSFCSPVLLASPETSGTTLIQGLCGFSPSNLKCFCSLTSFKS